MGILYKIFKALDGNSSGESGDNKKKTKPVVVKKLKTVKHESYGSK